MSAIFAQAHLLLSAVNAILPLIASNSRGRVADILDLVGKALRAGEAVSQEANDLAVKLRAVRSEVEHMIETGRNFTPDDLDRAFDRVTAASAAFRTALAAAEARSRDCAARKRGRTTVRGDCRHPPIALGSCEFDAKSAPPAGDVASVAGFGFGGA
jgi:hypothetical protein